MIEAEKVMEYLADRRKVKGLTQTTVARRMGVTKSRASQIECQGTNVKLSTLLAYAAAIDEYLEVRFVLKEGEDDLDAFIREQMVDPEFREAYERAEEKAKEERASSQAESLPGSDQ